VGVFVGVGVEVGVEVKVAVAVGVAVSVEVGVAVGVDVSVGVDVTVAVDVVVDGTVNVGEGSPGTGVTVAGSCVGAIGVADAEIAVGGAGTGVGARIVRRTATDPPWPFPSTCQVPGTTFVGTGICC
jgi:hypothetical protein